MLVAAFTTCGTDLLGVEPRRQQCYPNTRIRAPDVRLSHCIGYQRPGQKTLAKSTSLF